MYKPRVPKWFIREYRKARERPDAPPPIRDWKRFNRGLRKTLRGVWILAGAVASAVVLALAILLALLAAMLRRK